MRHRAPRPIVGFFRGLPRVTARRLGAATAHVPVRAVGLLVVVLGLGAGGYLASVGSDPSTPETGPPPPAPADAGSAHPTGEPSASAGRSPDARDPGPAVSSAESTTAAESTPRGGDASARGSEASPSSEPGSALRTRLGEVTDSPSVGPGVGAAEPSTSPAGPGADSSPSLEDLEPPSTSLSGEFPEPDAAVFSFSSDEAASFSCSLDGAGYTSCGSPTRYSDLDPGWHTFAVRATDASGNVDPSPAETRWLATDGHSHVP